MVGPARLKLRSRGRLWLAVPLAALAAWLCLVVVAYPESSGRPGERWLSDAFDIGVYWKRAQFVASGKVPYRETFSEYPVIATLSFALPLVADPDLGRRAYRLAWNLLMALPFTAALLLIQRARRAAEVQAWPIVLMASPTLIYFSVNRFDILPALTCLASLALFHDRRFVAAHVLIGLGVNIKWYPAVLFPVYLAYHLEAEGLFRSRLRGIWRSQSLRYGLVFVGTVAFVALICIAAFGWEGYARTYRFHGRRGAQYFNLYWLAVRGLEQMGWKSAFVMPKLSVLFLAGQVSIVWVLLVKRLRSMRDVDRYAVLSVVLFIVFAKVDSPQWIVWYVPLALTFVRQPRTLAAILLLTLLNYGVFPLAFDELEPLLTRNAIALDPELAFSAVVFAKDLALLAMVASILLYETDPAHDAPDPGRASPEVPA